MNSGDSIRVLAGGQAGLLYRDELFLHYLGDCLYDMVLSAGDEAALARMLFNINTVEANWEGVFRSCLLLALKRFGCRVVSNEYEFYEVVNRCSNKRSLYSVDLLEVRRRLPGFYTVTVRVCDKYFRVLGSRERDIVLAHSVSGEGVSVYEISLEQDPLEEDCFIQKLLVIVPTAGSYTLRYEVRFSVDPFTVASLPLPAEFQLYFDSPTPPAEPYTVRRYNFHREVIVHTHSADVVDFHMVYPGSAGVELPSKWSCKPLHTKIEDAPIGYWVCTRIQEGLASLVYMPAGEVGKAGLSRSEWEALLGRLAGREYVQQPIGYSPRRRAMFFAPPANGTLHIYYDRISAIDNDTYETIIKWLERLVNKYHRDYGEAHEALYPWNIFVDSVGLRIGPPRLFLERALGVEIPVLDDSKALEVARDLLQGKRSKREYEELLAATRKLKSYYASYYYQRGIWSRIMKLSKFLARDSREA